MRKRTLGVVVAIVGLALGGWAPPGTGGREAETPVQDVLFLRTGGGTTLVRTGEAAAQVFPGGIPASDWSAVVRATMRRRETQVVALDTSGTRLWSSVVRGSLEVKLASAHADLVALGPPGGSTGYPTGRSWTTLVVVGPDPMDPNTIELRGNYEPEAFSTDGGSLFVVQYLPPLRPSHYRVRRLDLRTERVEGVYTVDGHLQEAMRGTARIQAASPDGRRLYTLYTLDEPDGTRRAFVHVLSLDELWAHCVDLPEGFATAGEQALAIAVASDGERVFVADATSGAVSEIDTGALRVTRTAPAAFFAPGGTAQAVAGHDGTLSLAKGGRLVVLDGATLTTRRTRDLGQRITGLQAGRAPGRLYVGVKDRILVLDTRTGLQLAVIDPTNLGTIDQLGASTRWLEEQRTAFTCAC